MKKSIQNRIRKGLFPEMPQSFADRLTGALKIGGALNADQRSADEAPTAPVLPERSKRRFPFGKIFNGVAAAVLAVLCIVIAVFGIILPNVQKTHGATHPDGYRADFPVGKWTRTRSKYASQGTDYSWIDVDMESWQSWLEITADGHAHLTEYDSESGEALHADFSVAIGSDGIQTDWESCTGMWYDTAADTICMEIVGRRRDYYSRTPDAVIPAGERREITALRSQYPEYFGLDTSKGLKVYVWQMAESDYSCALLSGTDERSEIEIGLQCKGTTIEQMRLILSTYGLEEKDIEIVPFENPISSYAYEIDKMYTAQVTWLLLGTPIEDGGDLFHTAPIDTAVYDVDGDGQLETCVLSNGPTSGLFTVVFHVYRNGTLVYLNTFNMAYGELYLSRASDGLVLERVSPGHDNVPLDAATYRITIENGVIVLTDRETGETMEYWGLADPHWNMAVVKTPEERLEGLWCAMNLEKGEDGLLEIRFYQDEKRGVRCASFYESGILYDGYTYTLEEQESDRQDCSKSYLFTFANENGHERKLILYIRDHNEDEIDEDRTPWKDDSEQHTFDTFLKLTPITAEELPMKQDKYIFAGEGRVHYLDLVELNGDGEPVRVSVYGYRPVSVVTGEEGESELTVQIGACEWKINEKLVMDSGIYIDLDPNDGHGNLLLSTTRADGTERTYELHLEKNAEAFGDRRDSFTLVCGHTAEGRCTIEYGTDMEKLLYLCKPAPLGSIDAQRVVSGEALQPESDWWIVPRYVYSSEKDRDWLVQHGELQHLIRALPCEIDGKPATLEPDTYLYLTRCHESFDRIEFVTEDGSKTILVRLDGGPASTIDGVPLADYFDNAPKG